MSKQTVRHGATLDIATPEEVGEIVRSLKRGATESTLRMDASLQLDGTGSGLCTVYTVPAGMQLFVRRVSLNIGGATDPSTGQVALNVAGKYVKYQRSGLFIEYGIPLAPTAIAQVPGVQTWSAVEGPYLTNNESFEVVALGLTPNSVLDIKMQGLLLDIQ